MQRPTSTAGRDVLSASTPLRSGSTTSIHASLLTALSRRLTNLCETRGGSPWCRSACRWGAVGGGRCGRTSSSRSGRSATGVSQSLRTTWGGSVSLHVEFRMRAQVAAAGADAVRAELMPSGQGGDRDAMRTAGVTACGWGRGRCLRDVHVLDRGRLRCNDRTSISDGGDIEWRVDRVDAGCSEPLRRHPTRSRRIPYVCARRRRPGPLLGLKRLRTARQQHHHRLVDTGGGQRPVRRHPTRSRKGPHVCARRRRTGPLLG